MAATVNTDKTLIIDCDPGCDDALALLLAIRKGGYKHVIITTVAGNVPVERTTFNAQKVASLALYKLDNKPEIFIHKGSGISLMGTAPNVMSVHGRDGLGDMPMKLYPNNKELQMIPANISLSATELLKKIIDSPKDDAIYDLVCTGPLTNIATALNLSSSPEQFISRFEKIVIMGGAFKHRGNITPTAEYNFFFDPVAVKIFLDTLKKCTEAEVLKKVVFVPLDVTEKTQLKWEDIKDIDKDEISLWISCMLQKYFLFHAFSAQVLKDNCSSYSCEHEKLSCCQFKDENNYKKMWENLKNDRLIGKSGRKHLPRFSYLHDPLAVYFAMNFNLDLTEEATITIHTDDDNMRGSVSIITDKVSMSAREAYTRGTKARYLSPNLVKVEYIKDFKKMLHKACRFS